MSQHQARVPVKRLKQTALKWKVKDKVTSQLARSDARLADRSQWRKSGEIERETALPEVLAGGTAVLTPPKVQISEGQCRVLLREISKEHITFYNCEAVSVKCHLYYDQCRV